MQESAVRVMGWGGNYWTAEIWVLMTLYQVICQTSQEWDHGYHLDHCLVLTQAQKQRYMPGLSNKWRLLWWPDNFSVDQMISVAPSFSPGSYLTLREEEGEQFLHWCEESARGCVGVHGSEQTWGRGGCVDRGAIKQLGTMCRRKMSSWRSRYFM